MKRVVFSFLTAVALLGAAVPAVALQGFSQSQPGNTVVVPWRTGENRGSFVDLKNLTADKCVNVHIAIYPDNPNGPGCVEAVDFFTVITPLGGKVIDLTAVKVSADAPPFALFGSGMLIATAYKLDEGQECIEGRSHLPLTFTYEDDVLFGRFSMNNIPTTSAGSDHGIMFGLDEDGLPNLPDEKVRRAAAPTYNPQRLSPGSEILAVALEEGTNLISEGFEIGPLRGIVCNTNRYVQNDEVPISLRPRPFSCTEGFPIDSGTLQAACEAGEVTACPYAAIHQGGHFALTEFSVQRSTNLVSPCPGDEDLGYTTFAFAWVYETVEPGYGGLTSIIPLFGDGDELPPIPTPDPVTPPTPTPDPTASPEPTATPEACETGAEFCARVVGEGSQPDNCTFDVEGCIIDCNCVFPEPTPDPTPEPTPEPTPAP